jgi:hypothetical protein
MQSVWEGAGWHLPSVTALVAIFAACTLLSIRVFRWE